MKKHKNMKIMLDNWKSVCLLSCITNTKYMITAQPKTTITKLEKLQKMQCSLYGRVFIKGFENESSAFGLFHCKDTAMYLYVERTKGLYRTQVIDTFIFKRSPQRDKNAISRFYTIANNID